MNSDTKLIFEAYEASVPHSTTAPTSEPPVQVKPVTPHQEEENPHCTYNGNDPLVKAAMQAYSQMGISEAYELFKAIQDDYHQKADELTNFDAPAIVKHLDEILGIIARATGA